MDEAMDMEGNLNTMDINSPNSNQDSLTSDGKDMEVTSDPQTQIHETGHVMGLGDQYTHDENGIPVPNEGYEDNIMGDPNGVVEQENIDILGQEILDESRRTGRTTGNIRGGQGLYPENNSCGY